MEHFHETFHGTFPWNVSMGDGFLLLVGNTTQGATFRPKRSETVERWEGAGATLPFLRHPGCWGYFQLGASDLEVAIAVLLEVLRHFRCHPVVPVNSQQSIPSGEKKHK